MRKIRALAAAGAVAATLMAGVVAATPASAATTCTTWNDDATAGITCSYYNGYNYVRAVAHCTNGQEIAGAWARVGTGAWSYAYCSTLNSSLSYAYSQGGN
ncbi:hypothetical protein ACFV1L_17055 [Kitasatospora sp. NPDC059646]|uniref:hypothetical protein n=1 Tax=Kitasatospora sp. NPDC059646 TaxID=3346893 RepID=UPI0036904E22